MMSDVLSPDSLPDSPTLDLQSVLYNNDVGHLRRGVTAMAVAAARAAGSDVISGWRIRLGNCSEQRLLTDAQRDEVRTIAESRGGTVDFVHFGENLGHGGGQNRLAETGDSDLIAFVNPDGIVDPSSVIALVRAAEHAAVVDARQIPIEHPKDYDPITGETGWASGAFMLVRRSVFDEIGGFDHDTFFLYCDDVDLSWRARLAGYRVAHAPAARMFHDKRLTVTADYVPPATELYYSAEASLLLAHKYSRPDIVETISAAYREEGKEHVLRALGEFQRRRSAGQLTQQLDPDRRVAYFEQGFYADHRF